MLIEDVKSWRFVYVFGTHLGKITEQQNTAFHSKSLNISNPCISYINFIFVRIIIIMLLLLLPLLSLIVIISKSVIWVVCR